MKLINVIPTICLTLTPMLASAAAPDSAFPKESVMNKGRWVKINIDKTGVYQLTDDELKNMGFDPLNVYIYGRGGDLQPTQFVADKGDSYKSDLHQVATKRRNGVTYFWAQATQKVDYMYDNDRFSNMMRFDRTSNQVFAEDVAYFLSDQGSYNAMPLVNEGVSNADLHPLTSAWSYSYHEVDERTFTHSGRDFFGETFVPSDKRTQTFTYSLPCLDTDAEGSITCLFGHNSTVEAELQIGFEGGEQASLKLPRKSDSDNYRYNSTKYVKLPVPSSAGQVSVSFNTTDANTSFAALDYLIVSGKRTFEFAEGETQFTVYPYEYTKSKYRCLEMPGGAADDLGVWQVTNSADVKELSYRTSEGKTRVLYLKDNHRGPVVFLDYSKPQYSIKSYEEVPNQNLHALGLDNMPAMVIITLPELKPAAERLAALHKEKEGIDVAVVLHHQVVNEFSDGVADPMAYRALAKMLYDRDNPNNRVFKNLLLFGPNVRDQRNILGMIPKIGTLISNQVYTTTYADYNFCLNDWYGMMDDNTQYEMESAYSFYKVPMQIGVGNIPVNDLQAAESMVDKIARFYDDNSFAYWLNSFNYIADGGDNNEHQNWEENLFTQMQSYIGNSGIGTKLYNNLNGNNRTFFQLKTKLEEGALLSTYTGHATSLLIGTGIIDPGDDTKFKNTRYGFSMWGACDVSPFDSNTPGVVGNMVLRPDDGFIAALGTTRAGYSRRNYSLLQKMQAFLMCDDVAGTQPLSKPRTLGEVYALAKTSENDHANKFAFHLIGDPAITLPMPTSEVTLSIDNGSAQEVYPGSELKLSGTVKDRQGKLVSDFNGTVVVKLCPPAVTLKTSSRQGSPSVDVKVDQNTLYTAEYQVKGGKFTGTMLVPASTSESDVEPATLRAAAYNPATRRSATGALSLKVHEYAADKAVPSDNAPDVEAIYANTPDTGEEDLVVSNFILHADISDDYGVMAHDVNGVPSLMLSVDSRTTFTDVKNYISVSEGGKKVHVAYPMKDVESGTHILTLTAADGNGQATSRTLNVKVGVLADAEELLTETDAPARENVIFISQEKASTYTLRILDATGKEVWESKMQGGRYDWNLKGKNGSRVPMGTYYAVAMRTDDKNQAVQTKPCQVIVF